MSAVLVPALARSEDVAYTDAVALGCYFPIPSHYRLDTRERSHFAWYDPDPLLQGPGRINIQDFRDRTPEEYELLNKRQLGLLTLCCTSGRGAIFRLFLPPILSARSS